MPEPAVTTTIVAWCGRSVAHDEHYYDDGGFGLRCPGLRTHRRPSARLRPDTDKPHPDPRRKK